MTVSPQLPALDFSCIGPSLGSRLPDVRLPDQTGNLVDLHAKRGDRRALARMFEEYALGTSEATPPPADAPRVSRGKLDVQVWTDAPTYRPFQQVRLHVDLSLPSGMHVFASPVPAGFTPLLLQVEPLDGLEVGQPALPRRNPSPWPVWTNTSSSTRTPFAR